MVCVWHIPANYGPSVMCSAGVLTLACMPAAEPVRAGAPGAGAGRADGGPGRALWRGCGRPAGALRLTGVQVIKIRVAGALRHSQLMVRSNRVVRLLSMA